MPGFVASHPFVFSRSVLAHLPHLLLGVMAGWVYLKLDANRPTGASAAICEVAAWGAMLGIVVTLGTSLDERLSIAHGRYNLPYIPVLIAIVITCVPFTSVARSCLEFPPLRWLGVISFGVYVYHLPCMRFLARGLPRFGMSVSEDWLVFGVAGLAESVIVSSLSYLLIERPLLSRCR